MPIPESQIETWSHRSQTNTAVKGHEDVRSAVRGTRSHVAGVSFTDYLQGSYRNYTNTMRDHDVDVVLQLNQSFFYDIDRLPADYQDWYRRVVTPATFTLEQFRDGVVRTLKDAFGASAVKDGNKAITVTGMPGVRLDADVLACQQYRLYTSFDGDLSRGYIEGVKFRSKNDGRWIINFPEHHYQNGVQKQAATGDWFKATVRVFKNARSAMVEKSLIGPDLAPSYFIQGLLYNVPNNQFGGGHRINFDDVIAWLSWNTEQYGTFMCQNGLIPLFGPSSEQWNISDAILFVREFRRMDGNWR